MASQNQGFLVGVPFQRYPDDASVLPVAFHQDVDLTVATSFIIDFKLAVTQGKVKGIKTLYINNSTNASSVSITSYLTNQKITIAPYSQAYLPILASEQNAQFLVESTGGVIIPMEFINIAMPPIQWNSLSSVQTLIVNTNATPVIERSGGGNGTDYSATPAALAANLLNTIPLNASRYCAEIQNQSNDQIQLVLTSIAGTDTIILLEAGGANVAGGSWKTLEYKGAIQIRSSNAASQVAAYEI